MNQIYLTQSQSDRLSQLMAASEAMPMLQMACFLGSVTADPLLGKPVSDQILKALTAGQQLHVQLKEGLN